MKNPGRKLGFFRIGSLDGGRVYSGLGLGAGVMPPTEGVGTPGVLEKVRPSGRVEHRADDKAVAFKMAACFSHGPP
jgi:hypothetical protein